jgi:hypothetical protein
VSSIEVSINAGSFFRVPPALLRALPRLAMRGGSLKPKRDIFFLLALHAQAAVAPLSECEIPDRADEDGGWITFPVKLADVLSTLGFVRKDGDFSGSAWSALRGSLQRLEETKVRFWHTVWKSRAIEGCRFRGELLSCDAADGRATLRPYAARQGRYYVLVPSRLFQLRTSIGELAVRMICWLLAVHRGRRVGGKLKHKWRLTVAPETLVDVGVLSVTKMRHQNELARVRRALAELEGAGVLRIGSGSWPLSLELSKSFFHNEVDADA